MELENQSHVVEHSIYRAATGEGPRLVNSLEPRSKLAESFRHTFTRQWTRASVNYSSIVVPLSERYGVDWRLVTAVIAAESNFDPNATSPSGAMGLMQIMPETALLYRVKTEDLYDPENNIRAGILHLRMLSLHYNGDLGLTVAAYHAGEGAVDKFGGIPPYRTTRTYVKRVLDYHSHLQMAVLTKRGDLTLPKLEAAR